MSFSDKNSSSQHPLANYQFSSDEIRVLRECNSESFFQRSLPLGTACGLIAYYAVQRGFLQPNATYGSVPKVCLGVIVGYFVGKFSYQKRCAEKLTLLPNSKFADMLRARKEGNSPISSNYGIGIGMSIPNSADGYSGDYNRKEDSALENSLHIDVGRPSVMELDDIYRPSLENTMPQLRSDYPTESDLQLEPPKQGTTYEEIRRRNRNY